MGIPWRVAFALQAEGWYLRSDIIWEKPNALPESVTDRPTKAHEYIFLLTKSPRYYYDAMAIREPARTPLAPHDANGSTITGGRHSRHTLGEAIPEKQRRSDKQRGHMRPHEGFNKRWDAMTKAEQAATGRNKRSVWTIATRPYPEAHFATYPEELVEPCILAGTSPMACPKCRAPWRRVVEKGELRGEAVVQDGSRPAADMRCVSASSLLRTNGRTWRERIDRGFEPTCSCEGNDGSGKCIVLDPFAGSGTTLAVAERLQRQAIGFELNPEYVRLIEKRLSGLQLQMTF